MLDIVTLLLGPLQTNAYLIADSSTQEAAVIDPGWDGKSILETARQCGWRIGHIWLTHAHFDHMGGGGAVSDGAEAPVPVALHPADYPLWRIEGGAPWFGMHIDPGPEPTVDLFHGQVLRLGNNLLEVRHTPGHSRGHVVFYSKAQGIVFCGDLVFQGSVGRTDLPGGDYNILIESIRQQILDLPDPTRLLPGHGPETTVGIERAYNPFLQE